MASQTGFNIQDFRDNISQGGVLQNNKFVVTIVRRLEDHSGNTSAILNGTGVPQNFLDGYLTNAFLQFRAEEVKLPGASLEVFNNHRYGVGIQQKFPTNINFTDLNVTFLEDNRGRIYQYMTSWMNSIFNHGATSEGLISSYGVAYKDDYATDISVSVYNNEGTYTGTPETNSSITQPVVTVVFKEAYPIAVNDIPLSWENKSSLVKVSVTLAYTDFYIENATITTW